MLGWNINDLSTCDDTERTEEDLSLLLSLLLFLPLVLQERIYYTQWMYRLLQSTI